MAEQIIDAEILDEPGTDLEVRQAGGLFRTEDPAEFLVKATATASALAKAVRDQRLVVRIGQGEHVKVEGWTMLGSLLGVFPVGIWTRKLEDGWEARVEARTLAGQVVGAAEAECLRSEKTWAGRDDYALRSMAQTRATSKALRMPLGFVMTLAGFDATPFEEMPPASELAAERKATRGPGGLTPAQKKLYAAFKKREEAGDMTQADLKALLMQAGAEDLAHASSEQCDEMIGWLEVDVPFDQFASEADVTAVLEIAARIDDATHEKAVTGIAKHLASHGGRVDAGWLSKQSEALLKKAADNERKYRLGRAG